MIRNPLEKQHSRPRLTKTQPRKIHVPVKTGKIKMRTVIKVSDGRELMPILGGGEKKIESDISPLLQNNPRSSAGDYNTVE